MIRKLHDINKDITTTLWCGPAALAAITGKPVSHCIKALRQARPPWQAAKPIKGVTNSHMEKAAKLLGIGMTKVFNYVDAHSAAVRNNPRPEWGSGFKAPTLARWCRENRALLAKNVLLVNVTGHYVVVSGRSFIDSATKVVTPLRKAPYRRSRVKNVFVMRAGEMADTTLPITVIHPPVPALPSITTTQRWAKAHGIYVEPHLPGEYWVYPPAGLEAEGTDPYYDEHLAYDAKEARERVQKYIELLRELPKPETADSRLVN